MTDLTSPYSRFKPRTTHRDLGEGFFDPVQPARFPQTLLRYRNPRAAARVGLEQLSDAAWIEHFGRFTPLPGAFEQPLALRYHGHQFQVYNPDIGDGRGFLFAQLEDLTDGRLLDLGTKGSGQTPYSRQGDGRLTLKGGVRELLATSLLEARGVNTSKTFSLIETGEALYRNDEPSPTRACVMVRLNHGHIRFGSFQRQFFEGSKERLARLLLHSVRHYMPTLLEEHGDDDPHRLAAPFYERVVRNSAETAAAWMAAGFVHGVLNTDNMNITGESFDYGPYRFLPHYDPGFVAAYFDYSGLYAFGNQPAACAWNLQQLGQCLSPLADLDALNAALQRYGDDFETALTAHLHRRLGIELPPEQSQRQALPMALYRALERVSLPYERPFFDWYGGPLSAQRAEQSPYGEQYAQEPFAEFKALLLKSQPRQGAEAALSQPYFQREDPITLLYDEIEALWGAIAEADDWRPLEATLAAIDAKRVALGGGLTTIRVSD